MDSDTRPRPAVRVVAFGLLAVVTFAGCKAPSRHRDPFEQRTANFAEELAASGHVHDMRHTFWVLELQPGTDYGNAWVGEVRNAALHVAELRYSFNPPSIRVVSGGVYPHFTSPREEAMSKVFTNSTGFVRGRDAPGTGIRGFSGRGRDFIETVVLSHDGQIEHVSQWIRDEDAAFADVHEMEIEPIELALPWLVSRYYSASRW